MSDAGTIAVYDAKVDEYVDMAEEFTRRNPQLEAFLAALPRGGRVLDLGCGPGIAAGLIAQAGHPVDALDASPEMIRRASELPGVNARVAEFADLDAEAEYDGIWASFSLLHAPRGELPLHFAACRRALRPGGRISVGMKTGSGESRDRLGRAYTYVTAEELSGLLEAAGFSVEGHETGRSRGLEGSESPWVVMTAHV